MTTAGLPPGPDCVAEERRGASQRQAGGEEGGRETRGAHPETQTGDHQNVEKLGSC